MSNHYTEKFNTAFKKVQEVANAEGEERGKLAFRDAMLELGHDERVKNLYRIQEKLTKQAAFFKPNTPQLRYLETKAKRNIILKCRQVGFTTLNCIRALDYALWEPNTRAGILCHRMGVVKTIFNDLTKFSYSWFVRDWGHLYNPTQKSDSATSLSFLDDGMGRQLNSSILVMHDFRSKTVHFMHVSEGSRIEEDRLVGSLNGVPDNGEITIESTAHGRSGEFYRLWGLYRTKGRLAPYQGFFIPWFAHYPEDKENWEFESEVKWTAKELDMLDDYPGLITPAHLLWRRWCLDAKCSGDEEKFENEYPTNDIDCFISGEHAVFGSSIIKMQDRHTCQPALVGHLLVNDKKIEMHLDPKGCVSIWDEPDPSHTYVIGADPSGGVGKDKGAAYVKDQKTNRLVARLWGDIVPGDFARELYKLARYYNNAWMCIEANNHGGVVIHVLKELNYRNLYKRKTIDEMTNKPTNKIGFLTNNSNKLLLTEKFKAAAKEGKLIILDDELLQEMSSFVQVSGKTGKTVRREAAAGAHDDLVMAAAFTEEMHSARNISADMTSRWERNIHDVMIDPDTGFIIGETG